MLTVEVPLYTMLADLDETLRNLLREELEVHGFEGVDIAFDAPAREWSGQLSKPTVNVFLYDLREAEQLRTSEWSRMHRDGRTFESRPPMVMEASYAVTAWTQAVEDEHRLLSQVLAIFFAYPEIPQARLNGRLANGSQQWPIKARIGQGKGEKSDFWSAVGGQYKVSLDLVIRLSVESGARLERGPEVRTQTIRTQMSDAPPGRTVLEMHRSAGRVKNKKGEPLANVWVTLPDVGTWTASKADGRFNFDRLPPGRHRLLARTADGREADSHIEVPGAGVDLVIDGKG
jgi:hypothetical protein